MLKKLFRTYFKKNIEKWIFFILFIATCIAFATVIFNLPYFKVSLIEQKIVRTASASTIERIDLKPYEELKKISIKPEDYFKNFSRDIFSPLVEQIECPSCKKSVAKNLDVCPLCSYKFDTDEDGIPNEWEKKYLLNPFDPQDAYLDKDGDGYSNIDEYNSGTNPADPSSKPQEYNPLGKYRLARIYKKPVELLFDGYMKLPDGTFSFVINMQKGTHFKKIGDTVKDYKILDFQKNLVKENRMGVEVTEDRSMLTLETKNGDKLNLVYHQVATEKELWVQIEDLENRKMMDLRQGDSFGSFKITTVTENEIELMDNKGEKYNLNYKRSKE